MSISELVSKKNIANILNKLQNGKTLTASESACVREFERTKENKDAVPVPKATAKSIVELGKILGVSRRILSTWRKKYPDAPKPRANGLHDLGKWRAFIKKNNLSAPLCPDDDATENEILRCRKLKAEVELAEHKVAVAKGQFISVERIKDVWGEHISQARKTIENRLLNELPPTLAAMDEAVDIRKKLQDVIDEFYAALSTASAEIETSQISDAE